MEERQYSGLLDRWKNRSAGRSIQKQTMCSTASQPVSTGAASPPAGMGFQTSSNRGRFKDAQDNERYLEKGGAFARLGL